MPSDKVEWEYGQILAKIDAIVKSGKIPSQELYDTAESLQKKLRAGDRIQLP